MARNSRVMWEWSANPVSLATVARRCCRTAREPVRGLLQPPAPEHLAGGEPGAAADRPLQRPRGDVEPSGEVGHAPDRHVLLDQGERTVGEEPRVGGSRQPRAQSLTQPAGEHRAGGVVPVQDRLRDVADQLGLVEHLDPVPERGAVVPERRGGRRVEQRADRPSPALEDPLGHPARRPADDGRSLVDHHVEGGIAQHPSSHAHAGRQLPPGHPEVAHEVGQVRGRRVAVDRGRRLRVELPLRPR